MCVREGACVVCCRSARCNARDFALGIVELVWLVEAHCEHRFVYQIYILLLGGESFCQNVSFTEDLLLVYLGGTMNFTFHACLYKMLSMSR